MGVFDALKPPAPEADPWAMLARDPAEWDIELLFTQRRGTPVSPVPHVMLATPAYNPPCLEFLRARDEVVKDLTTHEVDVTVITSPGDSLVMRGRHTLMHAFLRSVATHLLFWDVDIEPLDPTVVRQMLATDHPVIGGACPFRNDTGKVVCNLRQEDRERKRIDSDDKGCVPVSEVGTGFLLISREAIITLCEKYPELLYFSDLPTGFGDPMWALFDTQIKDRRFLSEDYFFCQLVREAGMSVHVYVPFEAQHWGRKGYRASFMTAWGMKEAAE